MTHGYYVMHPDCKIEVTSNVRPDAPLDERQELVDDQPDSQGRHPPLDPLEIVEEARRYSCPACRGRHRPHTRDHACHLAEADVDEETESDVDEDEEELVRGGR